MASAEAAATGKKLDQGKKPINVKFGINHITALVEAKKAQLVIIADDVDPIEIVVWLPALCRKMDVPYAIVKSKSRLGTVVHCKTATALALTEVRPEDKHEFAALVSATRYVYLHPSYPLLVLRSTIRPRRPEPPGEEESWDSRVDRRPPSKSVLLPRRLVLVVRVCLKNFIQSIFVFSP